MGRYCPECETRFDDDSLQICPQDGSKLFRMEVPAGGDPLVGAVIDGRFRIDKILGQGGMGTVYRGVQLSVGRDVAIKVLKPEMANQQIALERFFREAKTISNLSHPNIVRLIDFGQDPERDILYLVMELVNGFDLGDLLQRGRVRMSVALDVLYQACGALSEPHAAGVIHRDLKPDNILIVPMSDGAIQTKVLDFGIARALEQNTQITATGMICGTPAYMAPEQAQNADLDSRTDLYSLGVIFYEMLSGWPPFSGTNSLQIMLKHVQEVPIPLRDLLPPASLIPQVEELAADLMNKEARARPSSARDIRARVNAIRREVHLEQVRVEADMTMDEAVSAWLLPKLPRGTGVKSGPTEVLRRETGMEAWLTEIQIPETDTNDKTIPLPKAGSKPPIPTWKGAQQAWTPEAQGAVQRIKQTNDNPVVDPFNPFRDVGSDSDVDRKTLIEESLTQDSDPGRSTGETRPVTENQVAPAKPRTTTDQRPTHNHTTKHQTSESRSDRPLLFVAILLGIVALGGATVIIYLLTQDKTPPLKIHETPQIVSAEPLVSPPKTAVEFGIVTELTRAKVSASLREGLITSNREAAKLKSETNSKKTTKTPPKKPPKKPTKTKEVPKDEPKKSKTTEEDIFKGLRNN